MAEEVKMKEAAEEEERKSQTKKAKQEQEDKDDISNITENNNAGRPAPCTNQMTEDQMRNIIRW
eukprot:10374081-Heterocapsa_arctica.AAC.1